MTQKKGAASAAQTANKPRVKKTRVTFIDGSSLSYMRPVLGIGKYKFSALYEILTQEIGSRTVRAVPPTYVMSSSVSNLEGLRKDVELAGFRVEPIETTRGGGEDDRFINDQIKLLDPEEVGEIIIVSSDRGYAETLRAKKAEGIKKIYWLAVQGNGDQGYPIISISLIDLFERGDFVFVDLSQFKERIMRKPWVDKPRADRTEQIEIVPAPPEPPHPVTPFSKVIKVAMEVTVGADRAPAILHSVGSLMGNISRLEGVIKHRTTVEAE